MYRFLIRSPVIGSFFSSLINSYFLIYYYYFFIRVITRYSIVTDTKTNTIVYSKHHVIVVYQTNQTHHHTATINHYIISRYDTFLTRSQTRLNKNKRVKCTLLVLLCYLQYQVTTVFLEFGNVKLLLQCHSPWVMK